MKNPVAIEHCRKLIEDRLRWGDPGGWTNEDFEDLSEKIFEQTSVQLSVSTLKRIWGKVNYTSSPTAGTLNALARFAGFEGWRELLASEQNPGSPAQTPPESAPPAQTPAARSNRKVLLSWGMLTAIVLIGLLSLFSARLRHVPASVSTDDPPGLRFESKRSSDDLPNSVVFHYDARPLHPAKLIIQQSWDTARRAEVDPNGTAYTSIYYYPGYFVARLIADGRTTRTSEVFIPTKGWKGIIERTPFPIYLKASETTGADGMGITAALFQEKTGTALFNNSWVQFTNAREFPQIPGDHFTLTTNLRNTSTVEQCLSRKVKITVLATDGAMIIPLSDKGCISDIGLLTADNYLSGKDHDLSGFGCDWKNFQQLVTTVKDHRLTIRLNGAVIMDLQQKHSVGKIMGIRISFEGAGVIREVRLSGPDQEVDLMEKASPK